LLGGRSPKLGEQRNVSVLLFDLFVLNCFHCILDYNWWLELTNGIRAAFEIHEARSVVQDPELRESRGRYPSEEEQRHPHGQNRGGGPSFRIRCVA
jgi:hypothetical protein